jgi:hypothetical protein
VDLPAGAEDWHNTPDGPAERQMRIAGNIPGEGGIVNFANTASHWWTAPRCTAPRARRPSRCGTGPRFGSLPLGTSRTTAEYPDSSEDRIDHTARLIVSALIAKIHTVEWTPGILATKVLKVGMSANWYGSEPGDWMTRAGMWLRDTHALKGIPETLPDHHECRTR